MSTPESYLREAVTVLSELREAEGITGSRATVTIEQWPDPDPSATVESPLRGE